MAEFKKLINPPIKASDINSESATNGQVLTANGAGGASWQNASGGGTEVVANPTLAGTETDLTGLEVAGTKYKVPSGGGTEVIANPSLAGNESDLTGLEVAGTKYKVPTGGSGGTQLYLHNMATSGSAITRSKVSVISIDNSSYTTLSSIGADDKILRAYKGEPPIGITIVGYFIKNTSEILRIVYNETTFIAENTNVSYDGYTDTVTPL